MLFPFLPDVKFAKNKRWLYNRIIKKAYINRPEERVRLGVLEQLLSIASWSTQRVGFEIKTKHETSQLLRTDIIAYNKKFEPEILIECKAPEIKINESVVKQAFRYNQQLKANWVICTNGLDVLAFQGQDLNEDFICQAKHPLSTPPIKELAFPLDATFWQKKGFIGDRPLFNEEKVYSWLKKYFLAYKPVFWLELPAFQPNFSFSHFYLPWPSSAKLWFSITCLPNQSTWVVFVDASNKPATIHAFCLSENTQVGPSDPSYSSLIFSEGSWKTTTKPSPDFDHFNSLEALKDFLLYPTS